MKQNINGMYLHKGDIDFLMYLFAVKATTYEKATRDIYKGYSQESVANRLRKMEDNKLLEGQRFRTLLNGKRILHLTKKGFEFVAKGEEQRIELKSDSVLHDLNLVDVRNVLMKSNKVVKYLTENEIQTWGNSLFGSKFSPFVTLNSDAVAEVKLNSETLNAPIEFESNQKSDQRYEKLLQQYYMSDSTDTVLYIASSSRILRKIVELEKEKYGQHDPKFFFCLKKNLITSESLRFVNRNNKVLNLST